MAYTKPGVTVTYQQKTVSPNLTAPDMFAVIVGKSYNIRDIAPDSSFEDAYPDTYDNDSGTSVSLSGLVDADGSSVDGDSIYVDFSKAGARKHLDPDTDFSYDAAGTVTISGSLDSAFDGASIRIGYRELRTSDNNIVKYESAENVEDRIGKIDIFNPLTWGLNWAMSNAGLTVIGYGLNSSNETTGHTNAIDDLELDYDPYIIAPMTHEASIHSLYQTHVNSMSSAANKGERILVAGR